MDLSMTAEVALSKGELVVLEPCGLLGTVVRDGDELVAVEVVCDRGMVRLATESDFRL